MLHMNNHKEAAGISIITTNAIEREEENFIECNKGIMSLTRRQTTLEQQQSNLMGKQRAKNDEHVLATTNNNYSSGSCGSGTGSSSLTASISKRKNANNKIQKSPKFLHKEQQGVILEKLHNNQPLIANIEHLSCQTHALAHTITNTTTTATTRANLAAYSQPYSTTNTLSTFRGKNSNCNSSALSRNSHYFSSLDNRSQRHHHHHHQHQHLQNYQQHCRQKKRKQTYDSLLPYSVANLPILQKTNGSSDGSSNEDDGSATTTTTTYMSHNKSGTTHYHMSQQQHKDATSKNNQDHYMSPIQAKSTFQQQQQQQIEITSFKQNKRHSKLQHKQERCTVHEKNQLPKITYS